MCALRCTVRLRYEAISVRLLICENVAWCPSTMILTRPDEFRSARKSTHKNASAAADWFCHIFAVQSSYGVFVIQDVARSHCSLCTTPQAEAAAKYGEELRTEAQQASSFIYHLKRFNNWVKSTVRALCADLLGTGNVGQVDSRTRTKLAYALIMSVR